MWIVKLNRRRQKSIVLTNGHLVFIELCGSFKGKYLQESYFFNLIQGLFILWVDLLDFWKYYKNVFC